jgi:FAD/FMN-containing dehydrogenase
VAGMSTREGGVPGVRRVVAPSGILRLQADEMIVTCAAATPVDDLQSALAEHGQYANLPAGGTVGGALGRGWSDVRRLGRGSIRDTLLQARYVSADGVIVTAGGPTVKNVTGFDLCRLLVGSRGTLGILGEVTLRTRPLPTASMWFGAVTEPFGLMASLHRPTAVLWDGHTTWICLEGHPDDIARAVSSHPLREVDGPPQLPTVARWSVPPSQIRTLVGTFVAEVGVGVVHHTEPQPTRAVDPGVRALEDRVRSEFDPTGRLSPGRF